MNDDTIKEFLKEYAEILREGIDITDGLPLQMNVSMPGGCVNIKDIKGRDIACVFAGSCDCPPSMPLHPAALTYAKLFVNLVNKYKELEDENL